MPSSQPTALFGDPHRLLGDSQIRPSTRKVARFMAQAGQYLKNEVASGRYGSASEVVREALRNLEEKKTNSMRCVHVWHKVRQKQPMVKLGTLQ